MNESAWLIAAVPSPVVCCRMELLPFSVGHLILLRRFESAFVTGAEIKPSDLFFSVMVCAGTYEEGCAIRLDDKLARDLEEWGRKIVLGPKRFLRPRAQVEFDFPAAVKRFEDYLSDGGFGYDARRLLPVCTPTTKSTDTAKIGSPGELLHIAALMKLGMTFPQAVNFPYLMGRHLLAASAEWAGGVTVQSHDEWEQENRELEALSKAPDMDALRAALAKGGA